ncbi:hypothetical protein, partial [Pseudomonas mandelii]|uniref:hypothetical protein n=1 Tax=Pseudomonas mandelii TaxID=75612 RepID=UPI001C97255B
QTLRQQGDLRPSLTFNKSLHDRPRYDLDDQKVRQSLAFSHSLDPKLPLADAAIGQERPLVDVLF